MKKVLMICAFFPPDPEVGAKRSGRFYKALKDAAWDPVVITIKSPRKLSQQDDHVLGTSWIDLRWLTNFLNAITARICSLFKIKYEKNWIDDALLIPDVWIGWTPFCLWRSFQICKSYKPDVIYVSCSPFSALFSAIFLKKIFKVPLVADFRDPWTLNPHNIHTAWHWSLIERIEKWAMRNIDHLILNSAGSLKLHQGKYPNVSMSHLSNGLDQDRPYWDQLKNIAPKGKNEICSIFYSGTFSGNRNPTLLFRGIARLKDKCQFKFICPADKWVLKYLTQLANDHGILDLCDFIPYQNEREIHLSLAKADLLYLKQGFEQKTQDRYVAIAAKTFEYLASGRPILLECPLGDNYDIIMKYGKKVYAVTNEDLSMMDKALALAYDDWSRNQGTTQLPDDDFFIELSPKNLGDRFKKILAFI